MSRRYSFHSDQGEQEPLDRVNRHYSPSPSRHQQQPYSDQPQHGYYQQQQQQQHSHAAGPGAHPDSSFHRPAAQRVAAASSHQPPHPPPHRDQDGRYWNQDIGHAPSSASQGRRQNPQQSITTPGADNFGEAAAGGMAGIAYTVAERNARESGVDAMRGAQDQSSYPPQGYYPEPVDQQSQQPGYPQQVHQGHWQDQSAARDHSPYNNHPPQAGQYQGYYAPGHSTDTDSSSSLRGLGTSPAPAGHASPRMRTPSRSPHYPPNDVYTDNPYQGYSRNQDPNLGRVNPHDIMDDGDEGLEYGRRGARTSMLSLSAISNRSGRSGNTQGNTRTAAAIGGGAAGAAAGGAAAGYLGHRAAHNTRGDSSGEYDPVQNLGGGGGGGAEKSEWLAKQSGNRSKWKWCIIVSIILVVIAAIVCGILFGVVLRPKGAGAQGGGSSGQSAADDQKSNGDLDINSADIKALMNNKDLHKVFPGMDYTPINTQYPECVHAPPSQNNVTRDVAVLSQLTNTIRLYGTDCNQTEMVIHALRQLKMDKTIKIWMGVWQDKNETTNARQLTQMWDILEAYGSAPFKGIIVANEILFRKEMTTTQLGTLLGAVRTNLTAKSITLPVATSDLGDKLTSELALVSDYVMGNIHPFFAGVNAKDAAAWTMTFWTNKASSFFKTDDKSKNVIAEVGWPTQGGTSCGDATITNCPQASVAGIEQANQLMADWVCPALANGTNYFWFSAFDEPWKIKFNEANKNWEDHWGLMDVNRNLKTGIKIPDCGGKTV